MYLALGILGPREFEVFPSRRFWCSVGHLEDVCPSILWIKDIPHGGHAFRVC